jgi:AcrR family transcriptional regulator
MEQHGKTDRAVCQAKPTARSCIIIPVSTIAVTPKGAATRAFILQTAAAVFAERGYAETTMAQLIERSGLTKGAFYFHFPSKEQLALSVLEEKQGQWFAAIRDRALAEPTAAQQLRALGPAVARLHRDDPSAFSVSRLSRDLSRVPGVAAIVRSHTRAWIEFVADVITRAQAEGAVPSGVDPQATAVVLVAMTDGLKDISDVLDPPARARRGYERRMRDASSLVELLLVRPSAR